MSGLQTRGEDQINGVDVREQGSALRVATNTPHLVSLGTGRLSTAVTLHPIKQGRVTIGSDPTCDIYLVGTGVASVHCRVENSHSVVTLYPISGTTLLDSRPVDKPTRLSQGSMLTIGRSNYLRFNHPEEAKLMKSVLPATHVSMAPEQFKPNEKCQSTGYTNLQTEIRSECYQSNVQKSYKDISLSQLEQELDVTLSEFSKKKPPAAPRKQYKDLDYSDSNSDQESKPKMSSIMAKVSKFEYYAKQQKGKSRSQFYTTNENEISPKVFSSNSLTVNTPAKDVLGNRNVPDYMNKIKQEQKIVAISENNIVDPKSCSYANVAIRNKSKIDDIVRNFDENSRLPKKINNDQIKTDNVYGKINVERRHEIENNKLDPSKRNIEICKNNLETCKNNMENCRNKIETYKNNTDTSRIEQNLSEENRNKLYSKLCEKTVNVLRTPKLPSPSFDRDPQYSPVYCSNQYDRSLEAEGMRMKAYQDRVKEEEQKNAETQRLEEILNMCAEYERQVASGIPVTPTEKRSQNKIITNGSLPRSGALNNPNFVQTKEGYFKFATSQNSDNTVSKSPLMERNISRYENFDIIQSPSQIEAVTPEVKIRDHSTDNIGKIHEIGIPVFDEKVNKTSSPIVIRKIQNNTDTPKLHNVASPISSPYENAYRNNYTNFKPKSPNTQSPRTRIKTTFAHKTIPSPQYFVFPTPPPLDNSKKSTFDFNKEMLQSEMRDSEKIVNDKSCSGIEKQLSLEEEIPMIDDSDLTDDIEFRHSKIMSDGNDVQVSEAVDISTENNDSLVKNQSFEDVKKELMVDIPELEELEKDLLQNKRVKHIRTITEGVKKVDLESNSIDSVILDDNLNELKTRYARLKEYRKKLVAEIYEIKVKMSEIRSQEDDILRELEMEKALIKGEYDSEIAILNIEQKRKAELVDKAKKIEEDIRLLKRKQESRQNEMRDRVEIATLKVERIERDIKVNIATLEELQNAQDILDNESKMFEDLEFQHLEEESELLSNREDVQNKIISLSKKIEAQKNRILNLKSEANNNLTSALEETKILQAEYVRLLNKVEELTGKVQTTEEELKPILTRISEIERTQSPDSAFYTDQTRTKSGEFGYSQSSDSDESDLTKITNFEDHNKQMKDKFNSIDQMSQSMIVDIERRITTDCVYVNNDINESPSKFSTSKEKKGFWERNFDSLKRKSKKSKSPEKVDIMSQSLNENMFYNSENIERDLTFDRSNSLRHSKTKKDKRENGPIKSNSSSKIPTFSALGKIMKKDSFGKKSKDYIKDDKKENETKNHYVKSSKVINENKFKSKSLSPDKVKEVTIKEECENELPNQKGHNVTFENMIRKVSTDCSTTEDNGRVLHRKSCGDEPNIKSSLCELKIISDSGKIPSQDDIDRISKVTIDAPILSSDDDLNTLGKRTFDSLMEIEKKRIEMLEETGCQVIEDEREKISELKRRAQDETKKMWDLKYRENSVSLDGDRNQIEAEQRNESHRVESNNDNNATDVHNGPDDEPHKDGSEPKTEDYNRLDDRRLGIDHNRLGIAHSIPNDDYETINFENKPNMVSEVSFDKIDDSSLLDESFNVTSSIYEESSGLLSSSIEELQVRNSRTESTEDDKRSDDSRPLSHASDFSRDNILSTSAARRGRRCVAPYPESQRPLTRYLPVDTDDFDLRRHIDTAGHQVELCPYVTISSTSCRGYLHKLGAKFHTWSKRWFVFDRETKTLVYYWDKNEKKPRGGAYFQVIEEVYLDHGNTSKSPNPQTTFIVKTRQRRYYLMAPSAEAARIWIDVIFTGAQGYTEYLE